MKLKVRHSTKKKQRDDTEGTYLLSEIAQNNAELGFVNEEYRSSINPVYEGSANDFLSSIVGNITDGLSRKTERLQNSLMEAGVDVREIASLSPIKPKAKVVKKKEIYLVTICIFRLVKEVHIML